MDISETSSALCNAGGSVVFQVVSSKHVNAWMVLMCFLLIIDLSYSHIGIWLGILL